MKGGAFCSAFSILHLNKEDMGCRRSPLFTDSLYCLIRVIASEPKTTGLTVSPKSAIASVQAVAVELSAYIPREVVPIWLVSGLLEQSKSICFGVTVVLKVKVPFHVNVPSRTVQLLSANVKVS